MNDKATIQQYLELFHKLENLKLTRRTGWALDGVKNAESIADHIFRASAMAMFLCPDNLDKKKVLEMIILHDLAESIIGDIVTEVGTEVVVDKEDKNRKERIAMESLLKDLPDKEHYIELWDELSAKLTPEARFIYFIDMSESLIQAYEYRKAGKAKDSIKGFWDYAEDRFKNTEFYEFIKYLPYNEK